MIRTAVLLPPRPGRGIGYAMSMRAVAWPEPDPQIAAAITARYRGKRPRPLAVLIGDQLGEWLGGEEFAAAFGIRGRPGWSPSRLALVTVLQRAENLLTGRRLKRCGPGSTGSTCWACPGMIRALTTRCWPSSGPGCRGRPGAGGAGWAAGTAGRNRPGQGRRQAAHRLRPRHRGGGGAEPAGAGRGERARGDRGAGGGAPGLAGASGLGG